MTILTAVDGETIASGAVERGDELASVFGVDHVVLHVMPQEIFDDIREATGESGSRSVTTPVSYGQSTPPGNAEAYTIEDGERHATDVARDVARATLEDHADTILVGRVGDPVEEILAEADRRSTRYLVIGGRQRSPVGKAVFGSKTQSILLSADHPVVAVISEGGT